MSSTPIASRGSTTDHSAEASSSTLNRRTVEQQVRTVGSRHSTPPRYSTPDSSPLSHPKYGAHRASRIGTKTTAGFLLSSAHHKASSEKPNHRDFIGSSSHVQITAAKTTEDAMTEHVSVASDGDDSFNATPQPHLESQESELAMDYHDALPNSASSSNDGQSHHAKSPPSNSGIVASQIVAMALNLSEGRRRHLSASTQPGTRRTVTSHMLSSPSAMLPGGQAPGTGSTARKHVQDQRRISSSNPAVSIPASSQILHSSFLSFNPNVPAPLSISSATLARAYKVQQFFELSSDYKRLLSLLPPLVSQASSGDRCKSGLSRHYNPLQAIRNRKARARARLSLEPSSLGWNNLPAVHDWVTVVENCASNADFLRGDEVNLPCFPPRQYDHISLNSSKDDSSPVPIKPQHPRFDWFITPDELLADAYWVEEHYHKTIIEDHVGDKIFPSISTTYGGRSSLQSQHSQYSRYDHNQNSRGSERQPDDEIESPWRHYSRSKATVPEEATHDGPRRLKHVWHIGRGRSFSTASSLSSTANDLGSKHLNMKRASEYLNTGPLEKHLSNIIDAKPSAVAADHWPKLDSPGTPNKWGLLPPIGQKPRHNTCEPTYFKKDHAGFRPTTQLIGNTIPISRSNIRSSLDDIPSSPTGDTPIVPNESATQDHTTKRTSPHKHHFRYLLPFSRSEYKDSQPDESASARFEDDEHSLGRQSIESRALWLNHEVQGSPIQDGRPSSLKSRSGLHFGRTRASGSVKDQHDLGKQSDSPVRRFLKGRKIGHVLRGDSNSRIRPNPEPSRDDHDHFDVGAESSDASKTSDTSKTSGNKSHRHLRNIQREATAQSGQSVRPLTESDQARFKVDLPTSRHVPASLYQSQSAMTAQEKRNGLSHSAQSSMGDGVLPNKHGPRLQNEDSVVLSAQTSLSLGAPDNSQVIKDDFLARSRTRLRSGSLSPSDRLAKISGIPNDSEAIKSSLATSALLPKLKSLRRAVLLDESLNGQSRRCWDVSKESRSSDACKHPLKSTIRDIARVRAALLYTGIRAAMLAQQVHQPRTKSVSFFRNVARTAKEPVPSPSIMQEHIVAVQLITTSLKSDQRALHVAAANLQNSITNTLHTRLATLRTNISKMIERARLGGDEAIGFGALVTGQKTIEVRQVIDSIENFRSKRRPRLRWLRRVGFGLLEWLLMLGMWWVWLVVIIIKSVYGVCRLGISIVRWTLWL